MKGYLLDTNIISALAPQRAPLSPSLAAWLEAHTDQLFLSAITLIELEAGIAKLRRAGGRRRADALADWLTRLVESYGDRILAVDAVVARLAGALTDRVRAAGTNPGLADIAIAATASCHDLVLLTANAQHFAAIGVRHANPFEDLTGR